MAIRPANEALQKPITFPVSRRPWRELMRASNRSYTVEELENSAQHLILRYAPDDSNVKSTGPAFVFVHGLCHSLVHFDALAAELAGEHGIESYAVGLQGHYGDPEIYSEEEYADLRLEDYAQNLRIQFEAIAESTGKQLIAAGHSMGGIITLLALTGIDTSRFSGVTLLSSVGTSTCGRNRRTPSMLRTAAGGTIELLTREPFSVSDAVMRKIFFNGAISDDDFARFKQTCQPESNQAVWQLIASAFRLLPWLHYSPKIDLKGLPVLNVYAGRDCLVPPAAARELARKLPTQGGAGKITTVEIVNAPHDSMLTNYKDLADALSAHSWL